MIFQLKQFFKPFPKANSLAFRFRIWMWNMYNPYNWKFKPVKVGPIFFHNKVPNAGGNHGVHDFTVFAEDLDIPTYLRNGGDIPNGLNGDIPELGAAAAWEEYERDSGDWKYDPDLYGGTSHNPAERSDRRPLPRAGGTS
jgi:hypothetical protein